MKKPVISLQVYSIRDVFMEDAQKAIKATAQMGYEGIEFFNYPDVGHM